MSSKRFTPETPLNRRKFFGFAGASALAAAAVGPSMAHAATFEEAAGGQPLVTGNGEWTYEIVPNWGALPAGTEFGGTHGAIATDKAGNVYVSTQSHTGILVYDANGKLQRTIANQYPEVHSLFRVEEDGGEVFYAIVQKGTPEEN